MPEADVDRVAKPARRVKSRRGMTLLEVVLATALLATVGAVVSSVLSQVARGEQQRRQRLHAYEVANRLILQYLDDPKMMPNPRVPYEDGVYRFRLTVDEVPVEIREPERSSVALPTRKEGQNILRSTIVLDVRVYECFDDGVGGTVFGQQLARITRPYSDMPLASANPDALARGLQGERLQELVKLLSGDGARQPRMGRDPIAPQRRGGSGRDRGDRGSR